MGFLDRLLGRADDDGITLEPSIALGGLVPDWPAAATGAPRDHGAVREFDAAEAPPLTIGILQWTPALLIDDGRGPGSWDYATLDAWVNGDMADSLAGVGSRETSTSELEQALRAVLKSEITLTPHTWTFTPNGEKGTWTAPLYAVNAR